MSSRELFIKKFNFGPGTEVEGYIKITKDSIYTEAIGYGFVTEKSREGNELMQIPEIGNAFELDAQFVGKTVTNILMEDRGGADNIRRSFCYSDRPDVPLYFKVKVPHGGNYNIRMIMGDKDEASTVTVFSERRRCVLQNASVKAGEFIEFTFTANVCDIVPRGKEEVYKDDSLDITIIGDKSCINALTVEEAGSIPTIYIAGDSTVTDQTAQYPYKADSSYCGWAQMFPMFLKEGIAVSNHAHSGLTTESFRSGGHWSIVEGNIKPGDFFFMQFGHNDQKNKKLQAFGGYADNLRRYIEEVRAKGAYPVIITPVSRTLWNAPGGDFNDLLEENAEACKKVAKEKEVPLIDLHGKSVEFILKHGPKDSTKFFYPKDYTHHNDFGGLEMAKLVVQGIKKADIHPIVDFLRDISLDSSDLPEEKDFTGEYNKFEEKVICTPVKELKSVQRYRDIESHWAKSEIEEMVRRGIMKGNGEDFQPDSSVSRVEALAVLLISFRYLPCNVYNDVYTDVFGDEWYAGTVQSGYDNGIVDSGMTLEGKFKPQQHINHEELISMTINAYKNKYNVNIDNYTLDPKEGIKSGSTWALKYIKFAQGLGLIEGDFNTKNEVSRAQMAVIIKKILDKCI